MEFLIALIIVIAYLLPSIVAIEREHKNSVAIILINLVLGWTFVIWFGCLIWSVWRKG